MSLRSINTGIPDDLNFLLPLGVDFASIKILERRDTLSLNPTRTLVIGTKSEDHADELALKLRMAHPLLDVVHEGVLGFVFKHYLNQDGNPRPEPSVPLIIYVGNSIRIGQGQGKRLECFGMEEAISGSRTTLELLQQVCSRYGTQIVRFRGIDDFGKIANSTIKEYNNGKKKRHGK